MLELSEIILSMSTDRFEKISLKNADIIASRMLELPCVAEVDHFHGNIKIRVSNITEIDATIKLVNNHLLPRVAKGERVIEKHHQWGEHPYSYHYERGDFKPKE